MFDFRRVQMQNLRQSKGSEGLSFIGGSLAEQIFLRRQGGRL
ncbi:hypothetical protein HMPREF1985_01183 [Mitsuokella sp. oral taxon 131 str. W9106]|nr:hypothetical protein HMPREF1985_01183 [Mitsuokella sp. oral taxon 131 str. W9106]